MIVVRCLLVLLVALQTGVAGGRAHGATCAGTANSGTAHVHAHQLLDLLDAEDGAEPEHDQDHDADAIEVTALLVGQPATSSIDAEVPLCLWPALVVVAQPAPHALHLLGLPPATAGPPHQPLYLTFCSFRN